MSATPSQISHFRDVSGKSFEKGRYMSPRCLVLFWDRGIETKKNPIHTAIHSAPSLTFRHTGSRHFGKCPRLPVFEVYVGDKKCDMDLFNVSSCSELPATETVLLEYNKKTYALDKVGAFLVRTVNRTVDFQIHTTSIGFAQMSLGLFPKQPTESWHPSHVPVDLGEIPAHTVVYFGRDDQIRHAAIYLEDGVFLSKIGPTPVYIFCTLEHLRQLYEIGGIYPLKLVRRCSSCQKEPMALHLCKGCRQATYCSAECQKNDWKLHKPECRRPKSPPQTPRRNDVPELLTAASPVCQRILHTFLEKDGKALAWITIVLNTCNSVVTPCTRLEEINALVAGSDNDEDMTDLCVGNGVHELAPFSVARLKDRAFELILSLSRNRVLGFEVHAPFLWVGSGNYPIPPPDQKFENKTYQAPFILRNGASAKTGHFDCNSDGYQFSWNRA